MPSTVTCSCKKNEPYPGYVIYDVTVTFNYAPSTGGLKLQTSPPPFAQLHSATGVTVSGSMSSTGATTYTVTFFSQSSCPTKATVLFREEQINPSSIDSNGCPCTNCGRAKEGKKKHKRDDKSKKK